MNTQPRPDLPKCPGCHGHHYPATTGAGFKVWCDGSDADTLKDKRAKVTFGEFWQGLLKGFDLTKEAF